MTDLKHQLRNYLEGTVPIDLDDIAQGHLRADMSVPRNRHPVLVVVAGALAALVALGIPALLLLGGDENGDVTATESTSTTEELGALGSDVFSWVRRPLDGPIRYPAAWNGGYVGMSDGDLVFSTDGISDWETWPHQPFDAQFDPGQEDQRALVTRDGDLIAVASTATSLSAYVTSDGQTWRDVPFEAPVFEDTHRIFTLHSGTPGVIVLGANTWVLSDDAFAIHSMPQALFAPVDPLIRPTDVWPIWEDVIWPGEVLAGAEKDGRFTGFGWVRVDISGRELESPIPVTYTGIDGHEWSSIEPITGPSTDSACDPRPPAIIPEVVETGPLGWFAAGSGCAPGIIWYSPDGLDWRQLDGIEGLASWDALFPFAPNFLIEDDRVLVYATQDYPRESFWNVWVGTPTP